MNNGLRHYTDRLTAACRSPLSAWTGLAGAVLVAVSAALPRELNAISIVFLCSLSGVVVAAVGAGDGSRGMRESSLSVRLAGASLRDWPNPALPIDLATRVASETLAGLTVIMLFQAGLSMAVSALTGWDVIQAVRFQGMVDFMALPAAAAWLLPAGARALQVLRGVATSAIGGVAVWASVTSGSPFTALLVAMALAVALFATSDAAARVEFKPRRRVGRTSYSSLARRSRTPLEQLWHDAVLGPIERNGRTLYTSACLVVAAFLLGPIKGVPPIVGQGLTALAAFLTGNALMMRPLGLTSVGAPTRLGGQALVGGGSWAGQMVLPLRREWVTRAFYGHGLVTGMVFIGLGQISYGLTGMPLFGIGVPSDKGIGWLPFVLIVPSFAGSLVSWAVGNRRLLALSLTAAALTLPAYGVGLIVRPAIGVGEPAIWFAGVAALPLALIGGGPPLKYLFPRRAAGKRRPCPPPR